jgi:hypothetical protein
MRGLVLALLLAAPCLGDLLCGGGEPGCAWHCGLKGQGGGHCGPALPLQQEEGHVCSCLPEEEPAVGRQYFWWTNRPEQVSSGFSRAVQQIVFLQMARSIFYGSRTKLLSPSEYGLERADNFYISHGDAAVLGSWFLWPEGGASRPEDIPASGCLVVYFHGNSRDRGFGHRVKLYKVLVGLGCHVLTFDYRSYGDSSRVSLTETSVVEDGLAGQKGAGRQPSSSGGLGPQPRHCHCNTDPRLI